jgi:hypothetical protein
MKVLGSEIKQFWNDDTFELPADVVWDCDKYPNIWVLNDDEEYELIELGYFVDDDVNFRIEFESAFKLWKKKQTTTTILIEVEKSKLDEVMLLLKDNSIKVVK